MQCNGPFALQVGKGKWNKNKKYKRRVEDNIAKAQKTGNGPAIPMRRFKPLAIDCLMSTSQGRLRKIAPDAMVALRTAAEASLHYDLVCCLGSVRDREASFPPLPSRTDKEESEMNEWHRGRIVVSCLCCCIGPLPAGRGCGHAVCRPRLGEAPQEGRPD